jgi:glycosyltransferase involved in cell wall biosynthesis
MGKDGDDGAASMRIDQRLSVVMSVYNAGEYLGEAVDSLLSQTVRAAEIILIDDGSTDGSLERIRAYEAEEPSIRVIADGENRGLTKRLNQGIAEARGSLIARMDSDDICEPDRFEKQLAAIDQDPQLVLVGSRYLVVDPQGEPLTDFKVPLAHEEIERWLIEGTGQAVLHPSVIMRRDAVQSVGGYDETYRYAQDLDLFLKLAEVGRLRNLDGRLMRYRAHFSASGYDKRAEQERCVQAIREDARKKRGLQPVAGQVGTRQAETRAVTYRRWGWWALGIKNRKAARRYALAGVAREPLSAEGWKLLLVSLKQSLT